MQGWNKNGASIKKERNKDGEELSYDRIRKEQVWNINNPTVE